MKKFIKCVVEVKDTDRFQVLASNSAIDRDGESIDPNGWDVENFKKNPSILWAHDYSSLPIGAAEIISIDERGLVVEGRFASKEANPRAEQVRLLVAEKIVNAVSVGFIPKERNGNIITKAELLEVSFVPVPANPEALALAISKGLDISILKDEKSDPVDKPEDASETAKEAEPEKTPEKTAPVESEKSKQEVTEIQTIILSKEKFPAIADAEKWAEDNGFRHDKVDETESSWRFRQFEPGMCQEDSFRTIELTEGVSAAICKPEKGKTCGGVKCYEVEKIGPVMSQKNKEIIAEAVKQMSQSIAVLERLLTATEPSERSGGNSRGAGDQKSKDGEGLIEIPEETLKGLLSSSRAADKHNEQLNAILKRILSGA